MTSRNYVFTLNNPPDGLDFPALIDSDVVRYAIWQLESGTEGTPHLQGYMELVSSLRIAALRKLPYLDRAHFESRRGTRDQARDYCQKLDTRLQGPWEYGTWTETSQGRRSDLEGCCQSIKTGATVADLVEEHTSCYVKYFRGIDRVIGILNPPKPRDPGQDVEVHFFYGESGCGKTRAITELAGVDAYWKDNGRWWDGYQSHTTVVADDFSGRSMCYSDFKRWFDRYPCRVERKGDTCELVATTFYISAISLPDKWWNPETTPFNWKEISRRITHFHCWDQREGKFIIFTHHPQKGHAIDQYLESPYNN